MSKCLCIWLLFKLITDRWKKITAKIKMPLHSHNIKKFINFNFTLEFQHLKDFIGVIA